MPRRLIAFAAALAAACAAPAAARAATNVSPGNLTASATWTTAGSPYVLTGDVTVPAGVTLTIQAGVTVKLGPGDALGSGADTGRTELRVAGTLVTQGTAASPVTLVSGATAPILGDFYGIVGLAGGTVTLAGTDVTGAYQAVDLKGGTASITGGHLDQGDTGVVAEAGSLTMTGTEVGGNHVRGVYVQQVTGFTLSGLNVHDTIGPGISLDSASGTVDGCRLVDNSYGVYVMSASTGASVKITHATIVGNSRDGVFTSATGYGQLSLALTDDIVVQNGVGVLANNYYPSVTATYDLVWGNTTGWSGVSAGTGCESENPLFVDQTKRDLRITSMSPARQHAHDGSDMGYLAFDGTATPLLAGHLYANTTWTAAGSPYEVKGDITVEPGVTLTIAPGAVVHFAAGTDVMGGHDTFLTELRVLGTLVADGTATDGITLTSASASPVAGDWHGVELLAGSTGSFLDYVTLSDASVGLATEAGAGSRIQRSTIDGAKLQGLLVDGGSFEASQVTVEHVAGQGVKVDNADLTLDRSVVHDAGYGLYLVSSQTGHQVTVTHATLAGNTSHGVYATAGGYGQLTVTLTDSIVANNATYGIEVANYYPSVTATYDLVWGNTNDWAGASAGTGCLSEKPLFVDLAGRDLRITSRSPARLHASGGGDIGALPFDGVPTPGLEGHLYSDLTLDAAGGPYPVLGDLTVEPGVTLTLGAGTTLKMATTDDMGGNTDVARVEVRVLGHLVVNGTVPKPVILDSAAASPAVRDWYGVEVLGAGTAQIAGVRLLHGDFGFTFKSTGTVNLVRSEVTQSRIGLEVDGGSPVVDGLLSHDNQLIGVRTENADLELDNAVVFGNPDGDLRLLSSATGRQVTVRGATLAGPSSYGVFVSATGYGQLTVTLQGSIVTGTQEGVHVSSYYSSVTTDYDDVWGNTTAYSGTSAGSHSISANPLFVDATTQNYHLLSSSPCVDAGDPASPLTTDADGATRPVTGIGTGTAVVDIGAYEYNPSANKWPIADGGPGRTVVAGAPATFDGSGSYDPDGTIAAYAWDFGDGTTGAGAKVTHTFTGGTDRTVTLTVTDNQGATGTAKVAVKVDLPPVAAAGPDKYENPGIPVTFDASGSSDPDGTLAGYHWDFGDGAAASGKIVTHQYQTGGDYTATLTVTDNDGATATDTCIAHITGGADTTPPTITLTPVADGQPAGQPVTVSAGVTDATGVASVNLYYRVTGGTTFTAVAMTGTSGTYSATIPGSAVKAPGMDYYLDATDTASPANTGTDPATAPAAVHAFTVTAADTAPPAITVTPVANGQAAGQPVTVTATVTDATGVGAVTLYYRTSGGGSFASVAMSSAGGSTFTADVPAAAVVVPGVDYYVEATDTASPANTGTEPAGAPGSFDSFTVGQPSTLQVGDLIVDEILSNPSGNESQREWFEIYNTTQAPIDVNGLTFSDTGTDRFTVNNGTPLMIAAGGYLVFGRSADTTLNGGVHVDYVYNGMQLANTSDEIIIKSGTTVIDEVAWDNGATFPNTPGSSMSLDPGFLDATANDDGANWCDATSTLADGDHGTPGAVNDGCGLVSDTTPPAITHTPVADGQPAGQAVTVTAVITDQSGVASATLFYRATGAGGFVSTPMTRGGGDTWQGTIPASAVTTAGVDYYLMATDASPAANQATDPAGGAAAPHTFTVGTGDTAGPQITHQPVKGPVPAGQAIDVTATVTDPSGVASVTLYVQSGGSGAFTPITMASTGGDGYAAKIPASAVVAPQIAYYLEAVDGSPAANVADLPAAADASPFVLQVQAPDGTGPTIAHTPIADGQPAGMALSVKATVTDPSGVAEVRVYFREKGTGAFLSTPLTVGADGKTYTATLPGSVIQPPAVEYYLEAVDGSPAQNTAHDPATAPAKTLSFMVKAAQTGGTKTGNAGGCGCTATGSGRDGVLGLVLLALGAVVLKRRRVA